MAQALTSSMNHITRLQAVFTKKCLILGISAFLLSCSGQQETEEGLEGGNQQGNLGADDAAEGNGQENFVEGEGGNEAQDGAETNSALANNPGGEIPPNENIPPPSNEPPPEQAPPLPTNVANTPPPAVETPAPAPANPDAAPLPGGRVLYAISGGAQVVNAPGGSPVATLEQGDHPVTWEENGWHKLANGMYVAKSSLSVPGVPRSQTGIPWQ